ncbi:TIR domain-containing protein [Sorangium sp. So ce1099]|uniref:TIR domain-containing protein n=1 Tax=unclassified Sorangium TaxID=2621164 RepID=UPI003F5DA2E7
MIQKNNECPCGSGKSFDTCHGMAADGQPAQALDLFDALTTRYRALVARTHPAVGGWPVATGCNLVQARYGSTLVVHLVHTGHTGMHTASAMTQLSRDQVGVDAVTLENRAAVQARMEILFRPHPKDMILVFENAFENPQDPASRYHIPWAQIDAQLQDALVKHEYVMGLRPMKIFLSHKGADKPRIRNYHETLKLLGFEPWLDEDAMTAGTNLQRGILQGMIDSCAAVFFVTPNYVDDNFLATEIDYAIEEKRKKGDRFAIITLVLEHEKQKGAVPELLRRYVWREPATDLEGLREIIKALPVMVGPVRWGR